MASPHWALLLSWPCFVSIVQVFSEGYSRTCGNASSDNTEALFNFKDVIPPIHEVNNATMIMEDIFKGYDKTLRAGHGGKPLVIAVSLGFLSISKVTEENMEFTADIYMRQVWNDSRLAFATRSHALVLQNEAIDKLWVPDTFFENAVKTTVQKDTNTIILYGDGWIVFSKKITVTARTSMDFHAYPLDKQVFTLELMSYGRNRNMLQYTWHNVELLNKEMSEFVIVNKVTEVSTKKLLMGCFDLLTVKFYAKRRIGYYVIRIYFPCTLCTVVSWMAFWMDCLGIGDRGTVGISALLSQMFLVGSINEAMPPVSYVKAADMFLIVSFGFTFCALLESLLVYKTAVQETLKEKGIFTGSKKYKASEAVILKTFNSLEPDNNESSNLSTKEEKDESFKEMHRRFIKSLVKKMAIRALWIDRLARLLFPLGYTAFIVCYFTYNLKDFF